MSDCPKTSFSEVKDSGKRQEFSTGSVRDTQEGKGMPHLIAGEPLSLMLRTINADNSRSNYLKYLKDESLVDSLFVGLFNYSQNKNERNLEEDLVILGELIYVACRIIAVTEKQENISCAFLRLAKHYENGARKYNANNWRLGQPVSRYYDSTFRHAVAHAIGKVDEDHASAILWNLVAIVQTKLDVSRKLLPAILDDFPYTENEIFKNKNV